MIKGWSTSLLVPLIKIPNNKTPKRNKPKLLKVIRMILFRLVISLTQNLFLYNNKDKATAATAHRMSVHNGISLKISIIICYCAYLKTNEDSTLLFLPNNQKDIQNKEKVFLLWLFQNL